MYPRLFQFGSLSIPTTGVFAAIAVVAALFTAKIAARRLDLDPEKIWDLGITGVLTTLVAPRLILIFSNWKDFTAHPLWLIGVFSVRSEAAVVGGAAVAVAAMCAFAYLTHMPLRRNLDAFAPALALGLAISDFGAFLAGADYGTSTSLPWAVTYARRLSSLWYGTPLGTPLHPVQAYAALVELGILTMSCALIARREAWKIRNGEIMGTSLLIQGLSAFSLSFLRGDSSAEPFFASQSLAAAMVLLGGLLWLL